MSHEKTSKDTGTGTIWKDIAALAKRLQERTSEGMPPTPQELEIMNRLIEQAKKAQNSDGNGSDGA